MPDLNIIILTWLADRNYKAVKCGDGHIHIYNPDYGSKNFPEWEIEWYRSTIFADSKHGHKLINISDPDMFSKLGELFPIYTSSTFKPLKSSSIFKPLKSSSIFKPLKSSSIFKPLKSSSIFKPLKWYYKLLVDIIGHIKYLYYIKFK